MTSPNQPFEAEVRSNGDGLIEGADLMKRSVEWMERSAEQKYAYNFRWLGRPIIEFPQDIVAIQVQSGTTTSSPGPTPIASSERWIADVYEGSAIACLQP